jgi:TupA-like ATPgrasp
MPRRGRQHWSYGRSQRPLDERQYAGWFGVHLGTLGDRVDALSQHGKSWRTHGWTNAIRRLAGPFRRRISTFRRLVNASEAFRIEGSFSQRLANLCVGLRWSINTTSYIRAIGKAPNYVSPKSWTEKVQWRKVFDHNPLLVTYTDKVLARDYMKAVAPEVVIPRTFWVGENPEDIPFDTFKEPYVIKPNHSSGLIIYVPDPAAIDRRPIIATCRDWLKTPYGRISAEWAYQHVRPRLVVEELLSYFNSDDKVTNYKFFVFSGRVRYAQFESKTSEGEFLTFFNAEGERLKVRKWLGMKPVSDMPKPAEPMKAPSKFFEMKGIAERIGRDIDMVRVDLYQVGETIYFSELTVYDGSGYSYLYRDEDRFDGRPPQDLNDAFGKFWELPSIPLWRKIVNSMAG